MPTDPLFIKTYVSWDASPDEGEDPIYILVFFGPGEAFVTQVENERSATVELRWQSDYHLVVYLKTGEQLDYRVVPLMVRAATLDFRTPDEFE